MKKKKDNLPKLTPLMVILGCYAYCVTEITLRV